MDGACHRLPRLARRRPYEGSDSCAWPWLLHSDALAGVGLHPVMQRILLLCMLNLIFSTTSQATTIADTAVYQSCRIANPPTCTDLYVH